MIVNKPKKKKVLSRYTIILIIMAFIFSIISVRLVYVQIYKHDDYKEQANTTSTKYVSEKAARGKILDQNGNILATNKQTYALTYTKTSKAEKAFYKTMDTLFDILSENNESITDDLKLKYNEENGWYISYKNTSSSGIKAEDIRFKRDRGLNEAVEDYYGYDSKNTDLTDNQISRVNNKLHKLSAEDVFYYLIQKYNIGDALNNSEIKAINKKYADKIKDNKKSNLKNYLSKGKEIADVLISNGYSYEQLRNYIVVKDALYINSYEGYKSITISNNIQYDVANIIMQKLDDLPGIDVEQQPIRDYPYKTLASPVLGYLSSISDENEEKYELKGYDSSSDLVGVSGIESAFEDQLRGVTGGTTVKVNSSGRVTEELFKLEAYPGNDVHLSIDKNLQYVAETSLQQTMDQLQSQGEFKNATRGAVVAMEVNTGRVLALASLPDYDPNIFAVSGQLSDEDNKKYFAPDLESYGKEYISKNGLTKSIDELFPKDNNGNREDQYDLYPRSFFNYATQGLIPPGSTFKPMTAVAGLETGVINPSTTINDTGVFNEHTELFSDPKNAPKCWIYTSNGTGHGPLDVENAIKVSCNYFFYEVAYRLYHAGNTKKEGLNTLASFAWRFGLGADPNGEQKASTGLEINENFGQIYNFASYKNNIISMCKYNVRDGVESGSLRGYNFVPFDYSDSDDDSEKVKKAKSALKSKITKRLEQVDPDSNSGTNSDEFAKIIIKNIKTIMNNSEKYKQNLANYESEKNIKVDIDSEASKVANAISLYVVYDIASELTSPAQEIYAAIGQGMNTFTPVQMAQYVSTLVNGGTRYKAHLVDSITDPDGKVIKSYSKEVLDKTNLKDSTVEAIKQGMYKVNSDESGGTATAAFEGFPIETAGKTGTADFKEDQKDYGRAPFATYISFAPFDKPRIAVVVVLYDAGHGGTIANVARDIYEQYFKDEILKKEPGYSFSSAVTSIPADNKNN